MSKKKLIGSYTVLFSVLCFCVFCWFLIAGKSFIWSAGARIDGSTQHYTALAYYGEYLREIIYNLFVNHRLQIPMWDSSIGLGGDIITTLNYYVMGDPLTLLSVFVPVQYTEYLYEFLIILRLYLAGVAFIWYCNWFDFERCAVLVGALVYVFSQYVYFSAVRHPFFINPMIYLPLLLLGIEKIYAGKSPLLFILSTGTAAASNFYFFYMLCVFMFLYAAFRYIMLFGRIKAASLIRWFLCFLGYFLVGLACGCVLFLPNAVNILQSSRMHVEQTIPLLYDIGYYKKIAGSLIGTPAGYNGFMGYSAVIIPALYMLFAQKHRDRALKVAVLLLGGFLLVPYAGHALNGFSYVSNRWVWSMGFLLALVVVREIPEMLSMSERCWRGYVLTIILYVMCIVGFSASRTKINLAGLIALVVCTLLLWWGRKRKFAIKSFTICCVLVIFVGAFLGSCFRYSKWGENYVSQFLARGTGYETISDSPGSLLENMESADLLRYDTLNIARKNVHYNSAMLQSCNGVPFYYSSTSPVITQFFDEMYLNISSEHCYGTLSGRGILDALTGCQYMVTPNKTQSNLPYGFTEKVGENQNFSMYYSDLSLPMTYVYDSVIERKEYDSLSVEAKQEAMLEGAVVEEGVDLPSTGIWQRNQRMDYEVSRSNGVELRDGEIAVHKDGGSVTLVFDGLPQSETYVIFENLKYIGKKTAGVTVRVSDGEDRVNLNYHTEYFSRYADKHNFLINTGYAEAAVQKIRLTFSDKGIYQIQDMRIVCQPMEDFANLTKQRKDNGLDNAQWDCNRLSGTIAVTKPKLLCITVPYSTGWSVTVDGREEDVLQVNTLYSGIYLGEGEHNITMSYHTPYICEGLVLTLSGIFLTLILTVRYKPAGRKGR